MAIDPLPLDFGRDKKFYVYLYRDPRRGKKLQPIYIGKGTRRPERWRADEHWREIRCVNRILSRVLAKIRKAGLTPIIEIVAWFDEEREALDLERELIRRIGRLDLGKGPLCNLSDGGDGGGTGHVMSEEQKRKISIALKGRKREQAAGTRAAHLGAKRSPEARAKMSAAKKGYIPTIAIAAAAKANRGRKLKPESIAKRSETMAVVMRETDYLRNLSEGVRRAWARRKGQSPSDPS